MNMIDEVVADEPVTDIGKQIAKEQALKREYVAKMNQWLKENGYSFEIINYSGGYAGPDDYDKGTREDQERYLETLKRVADNLQRRFERLGEKKKTA